MNIQADVRLDGWSTMGVGGPARWFVQARDESAVLSALDWAAERGVPLHVLGGGSNIVVSDRGFDGLVVQIDVRGIAQRAEGRGMRFSAGAGEPWDPFVAATVSRACAGLECLSGIPGLVGGTPVQNVGAYGQDVSQTITRVRVIDRQARRACDLAPAACGFGYRTSRFKHRDAGRFIVTEVEFELARGAAPTLAYADVIAYFERTGNAKPTLDDTRRAVLDIRRRKGMVIEGEAPLRSVGSFFVNPVMSRPCYEALASLGDLRDGGVPHYALDDGSIKVPAAWLIEQAGFRKGYERGPVGISPFQAQAIVNRGGARAADVVNLAADVKRAVWDRFQVAIVPEPVFVGFAPSPELDWLQNAGGRDRRQG